MEHLRSAWIMLLTILMAPFFVMLYYMINEATEAHYDIIVVNQDRGIRFEEGAFNHGTFLIGQFRAADLDSLELPVRLERMESRDQAEDQLKRRKWDALIIIPEDFSERIVRLASNRSSQGIRVEFLGDLTNVNYMVSAIWANEIISQYVSEVTRSARIVTVKETPMGRSARVSDFEMWIPGILILSIIMLMFTASIAIVTEIENGTIIRLKLSGISSFHLLTGIGVVQILIGIVAIFITLQVAIWFGFDYVGALGPFLLVTILTTISIIGFSLILASLTKSANEILVVGNFPLFLFMFFSGAAFPMNTRELFTIQGYGISWQSLLSPSHAVEALHKLWILDLELADVVPEILALITIGLVYFAIGFWLFQERHLKVG
jgi:ABC-2 type transport system permease protein